jgi:hypothetical protein
LAVKWKCLPFLKVRRLSQLTVDLSAKRMFSMQGYAEDTRCVIVSFGCFNVLKRKISYVVAVASKLSFRQYCLVINMRQVGHRLYAICDISSFGYDKWKRKNDLSKSLSRRTRRLATEELHISKYSHIIVTTIKLCGIGWAGYVAQMK